MRTSKVLGFGLAALAMVAAPGCCETDGKCPPSTAARPAVGMPALLSSSTTCPPPPVAKSLGGSCGEVRGDLVYNLGQGVISNSNAVRLAGGPEPRATRVPGGVQGRCNPVPERYYQTLRNAPVAAPVATSAPAFGRVAVQSVPQAPALPAPESFEPGIASADAWCAPVVCPVPIDSAAVCVPGDNLSECFTLSEEQLQAGPSVMIPGGDLNLEVPAAVPTPPEASIEKADPVTTDKYGSMAAGEGLPLPSVPETAAGGTADETAPVPAAPPTVADVPAPPVEGFPAVPELSDMEGAIGAMDSVLSRDTSALPEVELPPKLN